jgi:hypothetical protein
MLFPIHFVDVSSMIFRFNVQYNFLIVLSDQNRCQQVFSILKPIKDTIQLKQDNKRNPATKTCAGHMVSGVVPAH